MAEDLKTLQTKLKTIQQYVGFDQDSLANANNLLATTTDPDVRQQLKNQIADLNRDIADYQTRIMNYQSQIDQQAAAATANNPNPNLGANPAGTTGANTAVEDGGTTVQTFDDGSTITTYKDGSRTTTNSTESPNNTPAVAAAQAAQKALDASKQKYLDAINRATEAETAVQQAQDKLDEANEIGPDSAITAAEDELKAARETLAEAQDDVKNADDEVTVNQTRLDEASAAALGTTAGLTNQSATDLATKAQNADPSRIDPGKGTTNPGSPKGGIGGAAQGANRPQLNSQPGGPVAASAGFASANDMRVKLRVPIDYLVGPAAGPSSLSAAGIAQINKALGGKLSTGASAPSPVAGGIGGSGALAAAGGIIFPYTPTVNWSNQASYSQNKLTHSNFAFYNYQNSVVGPITVSGKFTAQNEYEAAVILSVMHLLRALVKMKVGDDKNAGAPPPVCRLDAYGDGMLQNVPVSVADWKLDLPDNVDYIQVGQGITGYGNSMVPTSCTISLTLNVMYSRQEALQYGVDAWLQGRLAGKGYL